jgi:RNA polymerase sigma factor (sigma-70 family)
MSPSDPRDLDADGVAVERPVTIAELELARRAAHVVEPCARRVAKTFPRLVHANGLLTREDLVAVGQEALLGAARAFNPKKSRDFVAFARHIVRYRMLDATQDLLFEERVKRAAERAEANYGAFFADDDYNVMKHDEAETLRRYRAFASGLFAATFTAAVEEAGQCLAEAEEDVRREYLSALDALRKAMSSFTEKDRALLLLVYRDGLLLDEAAARLLMGYSTAKAHHARVLKVLHDLLVAQGIKRAPRPLVVPDAGEVLRAAAAHNDTGPPGPG